MAELYYLVEFQCPDCKHIDEGVEVPEKIYKEACNTDGWLHHTCSKCNCDFKQLE